MTIERKNYDQLAKPVGPYVHAVRYNGMLFLSGLTAFGSPAQGGRIADQAQIIFDQIKTIAVAEGVGLDSLLKVTIFITSFEDVDSLRKVLFDNYEDNIPASSLVQVAQLFSPQINIEVEAIIAVV